MVGNPRAHCGLIGRENELDALKRALDAAAISNGSVTIVLGEPGIGKTRLHEALRTEALAKGIRLLAGAAASSSSQPFLIFVNALEGISDEPLLPDQEVTSFAEIFVVNKAGLLLGKASPDDDGLDADIFTGMLSAVQDFVRDSLDRQGGVEMGLGRLEYGNLKILIEHGTHIYLTAVVRGNEHPDMRETLRRAVRELEDRHAGLFQTWTGEMSQMAPVQGHVTALARVRFIIRRDFEGIKLDNERLKIADKVLASLSTISKEVPVLMILEDIHWADESSLFVLRHLARNIRDLRIMVLCTARQATSVGLDGAIASMKTDGMVSTMNLKGLDFAAASALIDDRYSPNSFSPEFKMRIFDTCAGNPFFIVELLNHMLKEGHVSKVDGGYEMAMEGYSVPGTIDELVRLRLETLDPDAMALAEFASCAGRGFETEIFEGALTVADAPMALANLEAAGIVEMHGGKASFSHALFQDSVYNGISPRWKTIHHKALGEYYEERYAGREDDALYDLARHFSLSNEHHKGYDYCVRAGWKAEGAYAFEQAITYLENALDLLGSIKPEPVGRRAELLEKAGDLWIAAGGYDRALDSFEGALKAQGDDLSKARLHRKRSGVFERKSDYADAFAEVDKGEKLVDAGDLEHLRLVHQKAAIHARKGEHDKSAVLCETLMPEFERIPGSERDRGRVLSLLGFSYLRNGLHEKAADCFKGSIHLLEAAKDKAGRANVYNNLGILHYNQGDIERARAAYSEGLKTYEELRDQGGTALLYNNIALTYWTSGRWDIAIDLCERSLRIRERIGDKTGIAMSLVNLGEAHFEMGDLKGALDFFMRNLAIVESTEDQRGAALVCSNIGMLMRELGDFESSETWYKRSIDTSTKWNVRDYLVEALHGLTELYIETGRIDDARALGDETERALKVAGLKLYDYYHLRVRGMLHAALGERARAESEFSESVKALTELKADLDATKVRYEWGRVLLAGSDPGEKQRGRNMLAAAADAFGKNGMTHWRRKCETAMAG